MCGPPVGAAFFWEGSFMANTSYRAILFDLDGTLCPMELDEFLGGYFKDIARFAAEQGVDGEKFARAFGAGASAMAKREPGLLKRFGGHAMAAGATIEESGFDRFRELFAEIANELLDPADLTRTVETDGGLESGYFSIQTAKVLEDEVWGQGFPPPLFEDEFVVETQRILKEKHLKLRLRKGNLSIDAIQFNFDTSPGQQIRAAYRLAINEYNGVQSTQLMIEHFENR